MLRLCYVLSLLLPALAAPAAGTGPDPRLDASRVAVREFGVELKARLEQAMAAGGPVRGIGECREAAPAIAAQAGERHGMRIGRTALRYRNPANRPDAWETRVLRQFDERRASGVDPAGLEYYEIIRDGDGERFRYMKAIPTTGLCLTCHGETIAPEIRAELERRYPGDTATGFRAGDLRGAFTVTVGE